MVKHTQSVEAEVCELHTSGVKVSEIRARMSAPAGTVYEMLRRAGLGSDRQRMTRADAPGGATMSALIVSSRPSISL